MSHSWHWLTPHKHAKVAWYHISLYSSGMWRFRHFFWEKISNMRRVIRYSKCKQSSLWPKSIRLHAEFYLIYRVYVSIDYADMISGYTGDVTWYFFGQKLLCLHVEYRITRLMLPIFFSKEAPESPHSRTV